MRKRNLRRMALVAIPVLALLATTTPPAHATTVALLAVQGSMTLGSGLSFPCTGTANVNLAKCPGTVGQNSLYAQVADTVVNAPVGPGGNTVGFSIGSSVCVALGLTTLPAVGVIAGACNIVAFGVMTGSCGLAIGRGNYSVTMGVVPFGVVTVTGFFEFVVTGSTLTITGDAGGTSAMAGVLLILPVPEATPGGNSCVTKTARELTFSGTVVITAP